MQVKELFQRRAVELDRRGVAEVERFLVAIEQVPEDPPLAGLDLAVNALGAAEHEPVRYFLPRVGLERLHRLDGAGDLRGGEAAGMPRVTTWVNFRLVAATVASTSRTPLRS